MTIEGCHVTKFRDGIVLRGAAQNTFSANKVDGNNDDGLLCRIMFMRARPLVAASFSCP